MIKFLTFILSLSVFSIAFGETYQYELKGAYKLESSVKEPVKFSLRWSEENGDIEGTYSDDHFGRFAEVSGEGSSIGRTFIVTFPSEKKGVRSITLLGPVAQNAKTGTTVLLSVITRDTRGNPLTTTETKTAFNVLSNKSVAQAQEESNCTDGFGELAGFCGIYAGLLAEESDRRNRCNLLFADAVRLELSEAGMIYLHLGEVNELINTPGHSIGRIPVNPESNSIDMLTRVCGPLSGVNSSGTSCKRMHLEGDFDVEGNGRQFEGSYTITEEGSNLTCRYSLSMNRQQ